MKLPKTQAETVQFLLMNASRLDDEHFNSLMAKLNEWSIGRNKPKYNQELIDKVHNREAVIEVDDFTIIKDLINYIYPDDPYLGDNDGRLTLRTYYGTSPNCTYTQNECHVKYYWFSFFTEMNEDMKTKPRIKASEFIL